MKFLGGPWTAVTRAGTFARFLEAHGSLERAAFLERVPSPHLAFGVDTDPRTWDEGILVRLEPKAGAADEVLVGRDPGADIALNCPTMSKAHARFSRREASWFVTDLASTSGTTLEGARLEPGKETPLTAARPKIGLGPDVPAMFLLPEELFAFLAEARARRQAGPAEPGPPPPRPAWPTWSLLQDSQGEVPTARALPKPKPSGSIPIAKAPVPPTPKKKSLKEQFRALFATPRMIAFTAAVVILAALVLYLCGPRLAYMVFGDRWAALFAHPY
jgi:hypothetical protein